MPRPPTYLNMTWRECVGGRCGLVYHMIIKTLHTASRSSLFRKVKLWVTMAAASGLANGYKWRYLPDIEFSRDNYRQNFNAQVLPLIKPHWKPDRLSFHVFESGVTNTLVGVYPNGVEINEAAAEDEVILLRINGEGTERIINRVDEVVAMLCFNQAGFCAPVYAQLKNGLCYGFCPGRRLEIKEATEDWTIMEKIACLTAKLHSLEIPPHFSGREPFLWMKIYPLLANVPLSFSDPDIQKSFVNSIGSVENLVEEIRWLKGILVDCRSPIVLCHNDIHSGNIIYNENTGKLSLVDYEYSGPNYLASDIANHFCEFSGVEEVDYSRYPSEQVQKMWIEVYLKEAVRLQGGGSATMSREKVQEVYEDVCKLVMGCHLFWIVWSLFQAEHSTIDFDFMKYAILRFNEYSKRKEIFLEMIH